MDCVFGFAIQYGEESRIIVKFISYIDIYILMETHSQTINSQFEGTTKAKQIMG